MLRLSTIVSLLCLALSGINAVKFCDHNRRSLCVPNNQCNFGFENDRPVINLEVDFRSGYDGCKSMEICCPVSKILQDDEDILWMNPPKQHDCGLVNKKGGTVTFRSANGIAQENEFPWMMALLHKYYGYLGGGSLIALDVVLTAHHITENYGSNEIVVRAGEWDFLTETERFPHVDVGVQKIVRFPSFNTETGANNLALLFLKKPFELSHHIRPICLPSGNQTFDKKRCFFSGWGKDAIHHDYIESIMKMVDLPVVSHRTCEALLERRKGSPFQLHESLMCAGGEGKDSCKGNGGSPLVCPLDTDPDRFEQAGIVNWGNGCGKPNTPGVYTNVAKFRSWIDEQIKSHSSVNTKLMHDEDKWSRLTTFPHKQQHIFQKKLTQTSSSPFEHGLRSYSYYF